MSDLRDKTDPLPNGWTWEHAGKLACERITDEGRVIWEWDSNRKSQIVAAMARQIAKHEKPPLDEAEQLWEQIFKAHNSYSAANSPVLIIREALAKARAGQ